MLVTFVVIISAVLLSGVSSSSDECQLGCNDLSYPPTQCILLYSDVVVRTFQDFSSILGIDDKLYLSYITSSTGKSLFCRVSLYFLNLCDLC